ncbi:hypothetical protein HXW87_20385 [Pseudomonas sp. Y5-11]|jgi:hypothetical protein|uniref:hypothetical protein n=1 Tax=unclassified Pseudomonas TaxID=196821 RepID=UPI0015FC7FFA|nr:MULTISPECIES: hypothetical protein [unclassified Pseudomonas]MBA5982165.1 hypothetical protein [Pseudomonas sp. MD195_PC81_125]MBA5983590.1 hypothetical protein [Pseudomonas sp. MD195_PC81_125]ULN84443.1 hypothetical protein HXW87_20385 [Pseudomonas sp. Y5-11]
MMTIEQLSEKQRGIVNNYLLDLLESSSLQNSSFLPKALESLIKSHGFGIEMSGIYISTDEDPENIPEYLKDGIAFEFMDSHVTLPFKDAAAFIISWCATQKQVEELNLDITLEKLKKKFS